MSKKTRTIIANVAKVVISVGMLAYVLSFAGRHDEAIAAARSAAEADAAEAARFLAGPERSEPDATRVAKSLRLDVTQREIIARANLAAGRYSEAVATLSANL